MLAKQAWCTGFIITGSKLTAFSLPSISPQSMSFFLISSVRQDSKRSGATMQMQNSGSAQVARRADMY